MPKVTRFVAEAKDGHWKDKVVRRTPVVVWVRQSFAKNQLDFPIRKNSERPKCGGMRF